MYTNVNLSAPIGALALLGMGSLIFVAVTLLTHSLVARKHGRARVLIVAMLLVAGAYLGALLVFSFVSSEKVLARGEEKNFCEIDCHLAYSVVRTRQSQTLGDAPNQTTARGIYTVVTIKTRFDETTIAPWRGNGQLYPNSRALTMFDEHGNKYSPSTQGQRVLDASQSSGSPLTTPLTPWRIVYDQHCFRPACGGEDLDAPDQRGRVAPVFDHRSRKQSAAQENQISTVNLF